MVRPAAFAYNAQTATNNSFQTSAAATEYERIRQYAQAEFDEMVLKLQHAGVNVVVIADTDAPQKPDAVFPNNWFSTHADGGVFLYPMYAENRRLERRADIIEQLEHQFDVEGVTDLSDAENHAVYLEGTGSMILDRPNRLVYACLSPRTDMGLLSTFCQKTGYKMIPFMAYDRAGSPVYHTNVVMALGETFAVICLDTIRDVADRNEVVASLTRTGKTIVDISLEQMENFAGNMLQVRGASGFTFLVMSQRAYNALTETQKSVLTQHTNLLFAPLATIETYGGGSARCMMAEIFLPKGGI